MSSYNWDEWITNKNKRDKAIQDNKEQRNNGPWCTGSEDSFHTMATFESLNIKRCYDCEYEEPIKFMED